jgi:hypothetical protein
MYLDAQEIAVLRLLAQISKKTLREVIFRKFQGGIQLAMKSFVNFHSHRANFGTQCFRVKMQIRNLSDAARFAELLEQADFSRILPRKNSTQVESTSHPVTNR